MLISDAAPGGESSDAVGGAGFFASEDADGFMDHGVVTSLGGDHIFSFLKGGEGSGFVAVDEIATGQVDPVVTNTFPLDSGRDSELLGAWSQVVTATV